MPHGVFAEAGDIQAVSVQVPTLVVEKILEEGLPPRRVVLDLLRRAVAAGMPSQASNSSSTTSTSPVGAVLLNSLGSRWCRDAFPPRLGGPKCWSNRGFGFCRRRIAFS